MTAETFRLLLFVASVFIVKNALSQSYSGSYYSSVDTSGAVVNLALKTALQTLISNHTVLTYDDAWTAFLSVDVYLPGNCSTGTIPDIYSSKCWTSSEQCGNYKKEGDCYNREHIFPKSWFGGFDEGDNAQTDLFELFPSDGYVNAMRSNYALGEVDTGTSTYTSTNGCMLGKCASLTGFSGECFEVPDSLKGDIARSYFYLSTAYMGAWECCDTDANDKSSIKAWEEAVLKRWHSLDPVDSKEALRHEEIFKLQGNRNPFIDIPTLVQYITDF